MKNYSKPALTFEKQIKLLEKRGLIITDRQRVDRLLSNISYYRLSGYMLPFKPNKVIENEKFATGTTWDDIYNLYVFDRKLRLLIFDAIERIEVGFRTQLIYQLSLKYGSHWQDNPALFNIIEKKDRKNNKLLFSIDVFSNIQEHLAKQLKSNGAEVFIKHYKKTYNSPQNPPCWMSVEILYFNHLSVICESLKNEKDLKDIALYFGFKNSSVFCSWMHTINYVRNICAHHSRLWNRELNIVPMKLLKPLKNWVDNPNTIQRSRVYYFLCMINYLLQTINPTNSLNSRLKDLLKEYPNINIGYMGFPQEWETQDLWK